MQTYPWKSLLLLAALFTALNAFKPLNIDDTAYHYFARQAADRPLDPYGFAMFWWYYPEPANHVLAPPVLPYWWSLALRLGLDRPWLWKLWLLPFGVLFVFALHALFRRFARGLELPLVWLTVLSPAFLPSFNLMLDVPALALSLAALALFFRAVDLDSAGRAALAGLVAGVAMQTKYTGFLAPAVMLLYALLYRRPHLGAAAAAVAAQVFVGWELLMALQYGESHFLHASRDDPRPLVDKVLNPDLVLPLVTNLGGVAWPVVVLALTALCRWNWLAVLTAAVGVVGFALVACLDDVIYGLWPGRDFRKWWHGRAAVQELEKWFREPFEPEHVFYGAGGLLLAGAVAWAAWRLLRLPPGGGWRWRRWPGLRADWFLLLWLGLEVTAYFPMTPFPAVRRVMGVLVVATLLLGRLAARACRSPGRRGVVWCVAFYSAALGLNFFALDLREALVIRDAAELGAARARAEGGGDGWYVGHWGFQFYAERQGLRPITPICRTFPGDARFAECLPLREGDVLVLPDWWIHRQRYDGEADTKTEHVCWIWWDDWVPLRTVHCYYAGSAPVHHNPPRRREVEIRRVTATHYP